MTAPRIARASRSRFFIGLGILILTMGFVAIFHSSQQQLDELRHMERRCEQQQESLSSQIIIIEKSLKTERFHHQQTKSDLQKRTKEDKEFKDKMLLESTMKFNSLQQHYKLLESQHDDLTESCAHTKKQHLEELNGLQGKLKSIESQNVQIVKGRDKEIELLKQKNKQLENEKSALEKSLLQKTPDHNAATIFKLEKQIDAYKMHCAWQPPGATPSPSSINSKINNNNVEVPPMKNFNAQISTALPHNNILQTQRSSISNINRMSKENSKKIGEGKPNPGVIINSVENFQMIPKPLVDNSAVDKEVLAEPPLEKRLASSSTASNLMAAASNPQNLPLKNAPIPTALNTPDNKLKLSSTTSSNKKFDEPQNGSKRLQAHKAIPEGVVPVPENVNFMLNKNDDPSAENENNRYSNVLDEISVKKVDQNNPSNNNNVINNNNDPNDIDNGAHEVNDNNDFLVDDRNHRDHLQEVLDDNKINQINNAAEDDTNLYDKVFNLAPPGGADSLLNNDQDLQIIHKNNEVGGNNKLLSEIDGDQGKVAAAYQDGDVHMEDQVEEEDDDEYANPLARKQDPAVRN